MRRVVLPSLFMLLLGGVVMLTGCSSDTPQTDTMTAPPSAGAAMNPEKKGNVMDTTASPAPEGVKTGLDGGLKK